MATYRETPYGIQALIYLGKDKNDHQIRPAKTFPTKKEAELWVAEQLINREKGLNIVNSRMLLKDFMLKWYKDVASKKGINTRYNSLSRMEHHIIPSLGKLTLNKLHPTNIQDFYNNLNDKNLAPSSKKKIMDTLSNALRYALKLKLIPYLPTDIEKESIVKPKIKFWTLIELNTFLDYIKDTWLYLPTLTMSLTGLRPAELMGLQWKKMDLENGLIEVSNQVINDKSIKTLVFTDLLKTDSSNRTITIPKKLIEALKSHKESTIYNMPYNFIITTRDGSMSSPDTFRTTFNKYLDKLRKEQKTNLIKDGLTPDEAENLLIQKIPMYNLRHTHATMLLNSGENIKIISERLGHKSVKTTMDTYASIMPKTRTNTADILDKLFE